MDSQGVASVSAQQLTPIFAISAEGGYEAVAFDHLVTQLSVAQMLNAPSSFYFELHDDSLSVVGDIKSPLVEGVRLKIYAGYNGQALKIIEGEITAIGLDIDESGATLLSVMGFDDLHRATRGTHYREFQTEADLYDSNIVVKISNEMKLQGQITNTGLRKNPRFQNHVSDLEFLHELAVQNGFQLWVEDGFLNFAPRRVSNKIILAKGHNILTLSARINIAGHVQEVEVLAWDADQQALLSAKASISTQINYTQAIALTGASQIKGTANAPSSLVIYDESGLKSAAEVQLRANAEMEKQRRNLITLSGSLIGDSTIRPGSILDLRDMGRFSGEYVVETTEHKISQDGYTTDFTASQYL